MEKLNQRPVSKNYAYIIVACAFLINFIGNYPQYQLSPLSYLIMPELNLSTAQFSSLFSSAMIPGILFSLVSGILCDKFGAKACIGVAGIISALGVCGRLFASNFTTLFICMTLSGLIATFLNSNVGKIIGNWFPPEKVGVMVGITMAGSTAAMAIAMGTTAMFPSVSSAYLVAAIISVAVMVFWFIFMKNKPNNTTQSNVSQPPQVSLSECLKTIIRNKNIWVIGISLGLVLGANMCLSTFLPQALQAARGFSATSAGGVSSVITFGSLAGSIFGPMICAKFGRMKPYLIICCAITALGTAFAWQAPAGAALFIALFITGFAASATISQMISIPAMLPDVGPVFAGTAGGLVATLQLLCGVILPSYVIAPLTGDNFSALYLMGGALALIAAVLVLAIPELLSKQKAS